MPQLVEFAAVIKQSRNVPLLNDLYQVRVMQIEAEDIIRYLAKSDRIAVPSVVTDEDAFYRLETETIFLPARTRAQVAVHEYAHHRAWVKIVRRKWPLEMHGPEFVRCLDLSAKKAWRYLTGE